MEDVIKSIKAHLYDRAASPLVFSFICSWVIWNYRLFVILLSGDSPSDKFIQIELLSNGTNLVAAISNQLSIDLHWAFYGGIFPLMTTLVYLYWLPRFEAKAFEISMKKAVELKKLKLQAEDDMPIGEEESIKLRGMVRDAEKRLDDGLELQRTLRASEIADLKKLADGWEAKAKDAEHKGLTDAQELRGEIDKLSRAKNDLEVHNYELSERVIKLFQMDDETRDFLSRVPRQGSALVGEIIMGHIGGANRLQQLQDADLIEVNSERVIMTAEGLKLAQLPREPQAPPEGN
jgi:hypothetical protein